MKKSLRQFGLNLENSIVIGSGILQALGIRKSKDIDLVVSQQAYNSLRKTKKFKITGNHDREVLVGRQFEIGTNWPVLDRLYTLDDFMNDYIIIDGVRYITLDFLYKAKKSWVSHGSARPKDIEDIKLIEAYKSKL